MLLTLERQTLGLRDPEDDHDEREHVETGLSCEDGVSAWLDHVAARNRLT